MQVSPPPPYNSQYVSQTQFQQYSQQSQPQQYYAHQPIQSYPPQTTNSTLIIQQTGPCPGGVN